MVVILDVIFSSFESIDVGDAQGDVAGSIAEQVILSLGAGEALPIFGHRLVTMTDMDRQFPGNNTFIDLGQSDVAIFDIIFGSF